MSDPPAPGPETPPNPPAAPPVLPYSAAVHDVRRRGRKPTTFVPWSFAVGSMTAGVVLYTLVVFLAPGWQDSRMFCCNIVVTPAFLTFGGAVAILICQMIVGWARGDGFLCGSDDAYLVAGIAHGVVSGVAWWAFCELMATNPSAPLVVKLAHGLTTLVVPVVAPVWMRRRPSAPGR